MPPEEDENTDPQPGDDKKTPPAGPGPKTFTQAEVDKLMGDTRKTAREATLNTVLKDLEVESLEALKTTHAEAKKLKESQMSDAEKQKAALEAAQKEAADTKAAMEKALATSNERLMKAAVLTEAAKADYKINPAAMGDLWLFIDKSKLEMTDEGDVKGLEAAIKATLKDRPYLLQTNGHNRGMPTREGRGRQSEQGQPEHKKTVTKL